MAVGSGRVCEVKLEAQEEKWAPPKRLPVRLRVVKEDE